MNDSKFQVTAKDVMDVYASFYEDSLKGPYVNCSTKDCETPHVFAAKFAEDYDGTKTEGWTPKEWSAYLKKCVCPSCNKESLSFEDKVLELDKVAEIVGYVEEATTTEAPTTEAPTTEAPTTEAPTTEAPTTVPTTQFGTLVYGDVNMDGNINIDDATLVQKAGINLITLTEQQSSLANVNPEEDKIVNIIEIGRAHV